MKRKNYYHFLTENDVELCLTDQINVVMVNRVGNDETIYRSARRSFIDYHEEENEKPSEEKIRKLLRYLMWHEHMSPFESGEIMFEIECPIFVARQIMRHRTFSYNELSRRYVTDQLRFYVPEMRAKPKQGIKQGSSDYLVENHKALTRFYKNQVGESLLTYHILLEDGVAPEVARSILPVNLMTNFRMKGNLRNWFHFLELRLDRHAQKETRIIAHKIAEELKRLYPIAFECFAWKQAIYSQILTRGYDIIKDLGFEGFNQALAQFFARQDFLRGVKKKEEPADDETDDLGQGNG